MGHENSYNFQELTGGTVAFTFACFGNFPARDVLAKIAHIPTSLSSLFSQHILYRKRLINVVYSRTIKLERFNKTENITQMIKRTTIFATAEHWQLAHTYANYFLFFCLTGRCCFSKCFLRLSFEVGRKWCQLLWEVGWKINKNR